VEEVDEGEDVLEEENNDRYQREKRRRGEGTMLW